MIRLRATSLERVAFAALLLFANACATLQPTTIAAVQAREVLTLTRASAFSVTLTHGTNTLVDRVCAVTALTGQVKRAAGDTVFFSSVMALTALDGRDRNCIRFVPGFVVMDVAAPINVQVARTDGGKTVIALLVAVVVLVGFAAFAASQIELTPSTSGPLFLRSAP